MSLRCKMGHHDFEIKRYTGATQTVHHIMWSMCARRRCTEVREGMMWGYLPANAHDCSMLEYPGHMKTLDVITKVNAANKDSALGNWINPVTHGPYASEPQIKSPTLSESSPDFKMQELIKKIGITNEKLDAHVNPFVVPSPSFAEKYGMKAAHLKTLGYTEHQLESPEWQALLGLTKEVPTMAVPLRKDGSVDTTALGQMAVEPKAPPWTKHYILYLCGQVEYLRHVISGDFTDVPDATMQIIQQLQNEIDTLSQQV